MHGLKMFSHLFLHKEKINFQNRNNISNLRKIRHKKIQKEKIRKVSLTRNRHSLKLISLLSSLELSYCRYIEDIEN